MGEVEWGRGAPGNLDRRVGGLLHRTEGLQGQHVVSRSSDVLAPPPPLNYTCSGSARQELELVATTSMTRAQCNLRECQVLCGLPLKALIQAKQRMMNRTGRFPNIESLYPFREIR